MILVKQLVRKYRVVLEESWSSPETGGRDLFAVAEKWFTNGKILPEYAPELGRLHHNVIIMDISGALSRVSPRHLQNSNNKTLKTNGEVGWDGILSNIPIYTATPSIIGLQ